MTQIIILSAGRGPYMYMENHFLQIHGYCRTPNMLNVGALTEPNSRELTQEALSSRTMMENW